MLAGGLLAAALVLAVASGATAVPALVIGLALAAQGLAAAGTARLRGLPATALGTHLARAGLPWAIGLAAAALLLAWPLARLLAAPSLGAALHASGGIGLLLVLAWRAWPRWQAAERGGVRAEPAHPDDVAAWGGLAFAVSACVVLALAVVLAWPGILPPVLRWPLAIALGLATPLAHWSMQAIAPPREAPVPTARFAAPDPDLQLEHAPAGDALKPPPAPLPDNVVALHPAAQQAAAEPPDIDQAALDGQLYAAARAGRVDRALELLEQGADPRALPAPEDRDRRSLPVLAAVLPDLRLLRRLIERGIDPNLGHAGMTPLLAATRDSWHGRPEAVMTLLTNGADPTLADADGNTPMHHAARSADPGVAALLRDATADINALNADGIAPLGVACAAGNWRLARFLLERGASAEPPQGQPALLAAAGAEEDDPAGVQLLLRHRARVDARDGRGRGALHEAAAAGHAAIARALLDAGADVHARDAEERTPLLDAARGGHDTVAQVLLEAGADPHARDAGGCGVLQLACTAEAPSAALLRRFLDLGVDASLADGEGRRASDVAAGLGRWGLVRQLEPARPLPTAVHEDHGDVRPPSLLLRERLLGEEPAEDAQHIAAALRPGELASVLADPEIHGDAGRVRWLLAQGADPDAAPPGRAPVLAALLDRGSAAAASLRELLARGASPAGRGGLARYIAASAHDSDAAAAESLALDLLQRGADAFGANAAGDTPLTLAVRLGWPRLEQALIDAGADLDARDGRGMSALHLAAALGRTDTLKRLVAAGANPELRAGDGQTPLGVALANGRRDLADWLDWRGWKLPRRALQPADLPAAAIVGDGDAVRRLLELGTPVDAPDSQGCTALLRAAGGGHTHLVKLLLAHGADPSVAAATGATPLSAAISMRQGEIVDLLLQAGASLEQRLPGEVSVLMLACALGHPDLAARLLQAGADVHARDAQGLTPLHCATLFGFSSRDRARLLALLDALLLAGAEADAEAAGGGTPLLLLLGARAEPGTPCSEDVLLVALERMLDEGARLDARDARGFGPLHLAGLHGLLRVAQVLLQTGADPSARDELGRTPREVALMRGYVDVAAELAPPAAPGQPQVSMARFLRDRE